MRNSFDGIFGIGSGRRFALAHIDLARLQDFPDLVFVYMSTFHAATGMFGQNEACICPVKGGIRVRGNDSVSLKNNKNRQQGYYYRNDQPGSFRHLDFFFENRFFEQVPGSPCMDRGYFLGGYPGNHPFRR